MSGNGMRVYAAVVQGLSLSEAGIDETPEMQAIYDKLVADVAEMRAQGITPEIPFDFDDIIP